MKQTFENKHYHTLDDYYKKKYGQKVAKIALNADFTCPNKDGYKGFGGCTYCSSLGSGDNAGDKRDSLAVQFDKIKAMMERKWSNLLYIPYLQANSNTYAPVTHLRKVYEELLQIAPEKTVSLSIATRPDCFSQEIYDLLSEINKKKHVCVELGLQTSNEKTAERINRCSTNQEFIEAVTELRKREIEVVAHIINGLPGESKEDMLQTIDFLNQLDIQGVKIHSLMVLKNTRLYQEYLQDPFPILDLETYVQICVEQIRHLKPSVVLHRISADAKLEDLVAPLWTRKKFVVMNEIDKLMRIENVFQGDLFQK